MNKANNSFSDLRDRIHLMVSNRLTYPRSVLGIAGERHLTKEEIAKAVECLETCSRIIDAELILFSIRFEDQLKKN